MAGRKRKRTGDKSFGKRMAALRAARARRGGKRRDPSPSKRKSLTVTRKVTVKRSSPKKSSKRSSSSKPSCTLEACRKLLARAEASLSTAQRRKAEALWQAGATARSERALARAMGPSFGFGESRPRRETPATGERGRFEGTFEERMGLHGRGFEGPTSPAHDPRRKRRKSGGRKLRAHRFSSGQHRGRRDASLMDMRDSSGDWRLGHAGHVRAGKKGARRRGLHVKRRDADMRDSSGDWRLGHAGHVRAGKKGARRRGLHVKRRDADMRDSSGDWRLGHAGHVRAGKLAARRRGLHVKRRDPGPNFGERMAALRDGGARDWFGHRAGHRKAAKKGWSHRHLCAAHSRGHGRRDAGRDARGDWPNDHAGHVRAGKKGARRRHACAKCSAGR